MVTSNPPVWALPADLTDYIVETFFQQPRLDSSALIRAKLPDGQVHTWLYSNRKCTPITVADHDKFKKAAKSRGGSYAMELCEFTIEQVLANGDISLFVWRRSGDDSGKGGRMILSYRDNSWIIAQHLGGWEANVNQPS